MIRRFEKSDLEQIQGWYREREMDFPAEGDLPQIGFIEDGVAAGFLFRTDSKVALIDGYVSKPHTNPQTRDMALTEITRELMEEGHRLGFRNFIAFTKSKAIAIRAQEWGFTTDGSYELFWKELE